MEFFRNLGKSKEVKKQEALNAYLDDALAPQQKQEIERDLSQDIKLQAELDQYRMLQSQMRQLPQRRAPRNFTLDPALYGKPRSEPLIKAYPVLRTATVFAALFFIFALSINVFLGSSRGGSAGMAESVVSEVLPEGLGSAPRAAEDAAEEMDNVAIMADQESRSSDVEQFAEEQSAETRLKATVVAFDIERLAPEGSEEGFARPVPPGGADMNESQSAESLPLPTLPSALLESEETTDSVIASSELEDDPSEAQALPSFEEAELLEESLPARQAPSQSSTLIGLIFISGLIFLVLVVLTLMTRQRF